MGAQRKFKDNYPKELRTEQKNQDDKRLIKAYTEKIAKLLEDPKNQKKAAEILRQMINNSKNK